MPGRIAEKFASLRSSGQSAFVAYVTAGDPSPDAMPEILAALDEAGTDIIELGIPFSDPLADGPTIQAAAGRALAAGMTVSRTIETVRDFRKSSQTPVVFFTYLNPVFSYGFDRFVSEAASAGADGLLVLDLPPEEAASAKLSAHGLDSIRLIAPTTPPSRMEAICRDAGGFIYYVSREGVTGERSDLDDSLGGRLAALKSLTGVPVAVGFGISTAAQAKQVAGLADGVVVGSAIVRRIAGRPDGQSLGSAVKEFVGPLAAATHSVIKS